MLKLPCMSWFFVRIELFASLLKKGIGWGLFFLFLATLYSFLIDEYKSVDTCFAVEY